MPTYAEIKADIDSRITNKTADESIDNTDVSIPMKTIVDKIQEVESSINSGFTVLDDIGSLLSYSGEAQIVFVKDVKRGGFFYRGTGVVNNGTIFPHAVIGQWIREFKGNTIYATWFGATGEGVVDDRPSLVACADYCGRANRCLDMEIPNGVYRVTDTWTVGTQLVPVIEELLDYQFASAPSVSYAGELNYRPFAIRGGYDTVIHGDFSSTTLKPIMYHCIRHNTGTTNRDEHGASISRIKFVGQGSYIGATEQTLGSYQTSKNQVGLVFMAGLDGVIDSCYFKNMQRGLILNTVYNYKIINYSSNYVQYSWRDIGSNACSIENSHVFNYDLAYDLDSTLLVWKNMWAEGPNKMLRIRLGNNIVIEGFYNECTKEVGDEEPLIDLGMVVGETLGNRGYEAGVPRNITIQGGFIPVNRSGGGYANAIRMKESAGILNLIGCDLLGNIITNNLRNTINFIGSTRRGGGTTDTGPGRITYSGTGAVFADNAAAVAAGLRTGAQYNTSTGEVRIVV